MQTICHLSTVSPVTQPNAYQRDIMIIVQLIINVDTSSGLCAVSCHAFSGWDVIQAALTTLPDEMIRACACTASVRALASTSSTFLEVFGPQIRRAVAQIQAHFRRVLARIHMIRLQSLPIRPLDTVDSLDRWIHLHPSPFHTGHAIFSPRGRAFVGALSHGELVASIIMIIEKDQQIYYRRVFLEATRRHVSWDDPYWRDQSKWTRGRGDTFLESWLGEFLYQSGHEYYDPDGEVGTSVWENPIWRIETRFLDPDDRPAHWPPVSYNRPSQGILRTYMLINPLHRRTLERFYLECTHDWPD